MCVIAICEQRRLTSDEVRQMAAANPHGIGLAWANKANGQAAYVKGLSVDEALAAIDAAPLPQVVHFRFASVGGVTPELCHPFPIERVPSQDMAGTAHAVVFHNGTWGDWQLGHAILDGRKTQLSAEERKGWSDTRVIAAMMSTYAYHVVAKIAGDAQRIVVVHGKGRIARYGDFIEHDGITVSNLWWRGRGSTTTSMADACRRWSWRDFEGADLIEEDGIFSEEELLDEPHVDDDGPTQPTLNFARAVAQASAQRAIERVRPRKQQTAQPQPLDCTQPLTPATLGKPKVPRPVAPSRYWPRRKGR
jgi:hypothetical protein